MILHQILSSSWIFSNPNGFVPTCISKVFYKTVGNNVKVFKKLTGSAFHICLPVQSAIKNFLSLSTDTFVNNISSFHDPLHSPFTFVLFM